MSILGSVVSPTRPRAVGTWSDGPWYSVSPEGYAIASSSSFSSGITVSNNTIKQCMTALAALRFLSTAVAVCARKGMVINQRKTNADERRDEVTYNHYLRRLMRKPNPTQNGLRWFQSNVFRAAMFGNSFNQIVSGPLPEAPFQTFAGKLLPLSSEETQVVDESTDGELVYRTRRLSYARNNPILTLPQSSIFHLRGVTSDGDVGEPINYLIRNSIGIALAIQKHQATFLRKGARLSAMLTVSGVMEKEARTALRNSVNADLGGSDNTGTFGLLPFGVDVKPISSNNRDAMLPDITDQNLSDILRGIGVPGIVVGFSEKNQGYGSAKEFFESGGLRHCVLPWIENFEAEIEFALVTEADPVEIEFDMDVLTRPETWARIEMLSKASGRPFIKGNEARSFMGLNPVDDDESMDRVAEPTGQNQAAIDGAKGGRPSDPKKAPEPAAPSDGESAAVVAPAPSAHEARARALARGSAKVLLDKEIFDVVSKAPKYSRNQEGWNKWVPEYYQKHAEHVANTLGIPLSKALPYCAGQSKSVLEHGIAVTATWSATILPVLEALALEMGEDERVA